MKNYQNKYSIKGITLVALVITIIILLILAGISIQAITNTGLFESASQAKKEAKRAQIVEWLNLKLMEEQMYNLTGTAEEIIEATRENIIEYQDELKTIGKEVTVEDTKTEEDGEQVEIYFYVQVDEDVYKVEKAGAQFIGEAGKFPPVITLENITQTTNSITIKIKTTRNEDGKLEIYKKSEDDEKYTLEKTSTREEAKELEYTFSGLEQNKNYSIKIIATAKNGQTKELIKDVKLGSVPDLKKGDITFTYKVDGQEIDKDTWTNKSVTVTASTEITGYTLQTSKDGKTWSSETSQTFTSNGTIYARLWDGTNYGGSASGNVTNIDKTNPEKPSIEIISGTAGENGYYKSDVQLKITQGQDGESGIGKVTYTLTGAMTLNETEIANGGTVTITAEGTTTITAYSYDKANNKSEGATYTIQKDSVAPTISLTQTDTSSREYSKTVVASVTDATSQIQIKKYAYKNQTVSYFTSSGNTLGDSFTVKTEDDEVSTGDAPQFIYSVYAKDNAGNETVKTITIQNLLIDNIITGNNGLCIGNGVVKDDYTGVITLPTGSNAVQYGPYWNLPGGTYEITYKGSNLPTTMDGFFSYVTGVEPDFSLSLQSATSNQVIYRVTIPDNVGKTEFVLYNRTSNIITINNIRIKQL